ncbi:MAG TPA: YbgC/FadM family acyl-CoA thioesterase [Rhodospirillaceae bacterium]|nr:YbgC/FadM family acyl-CoA thioesterase [Rhodospirillaceae bacterium]
MTELALSGRIDGLAHHYPLRVYFAETDAAGIVYHAAYLDFAERARTEMMRLLGFNHARLMTDEGLVFAVRNCTLDFRRPAYLDDLLVVVSTLVHLGGATLGVRQTVWRDEVRLADIAIRLACVRKDGGPARVPAALRDLLKTYLTQDMD